MGFVWGEQEKRAELAERKYAKLGALAVGSKEVQSPREHPGVVAGSILAGEVGPSEKMGLGWEVCRFKQNTGRSSSTPPASPLMRTREPPELRSYNTLPDSMRQVVFLKIIEKKCQEWSVEGRK